MEYAVREVPSGARRRTTTDGTTAAAARFDKCALIETPHFLRDVRTTTAPLTLRPSVRLSLVLYRGL